MTLWNPQEGVESQTRILAEVKSGKSTINDVPRILRYNERARCSCWYFYHQFYLCPLVCGKEPRTWVVFMHNTRSYPRLQFWQIDDNYFDNEEIVKQLIQLPPDWVRPIQKSDRHFDDTQTELQIEPS